MESKHQIILVGRSKIDGDRILAKGEEREVGGGDVNMIERRVREEQQEFNGERQIGKEEKVFIRNY